MATQNIRGRITSFKANSNVDYARPNLFQVDIDFPEAVTDLITAASGAATGGASGDPVNSMRVLGGFQVKAAQIPASTVGVIEVPFRGRMLKIAGDRTFEPWTITIHNDTTYRLRSWFEKWMEAIQLYDENATEIDYGQAADAAGTDYLRYMKDMKVTQLDRRGNAVRSYKFYDCWPSNVSSIDLDFGSNDAIEEFTVELQVQYWKPEAGETDVEIDPDTTAT
jgi:hypothetical protein